MNNAARVPDPSDDFEPLNVAEIDQLLRLIPIHTIDQPKPYEAARNKLHKMRGAILDKRDPRDAHRAAVLGEVADFLMSDRDGGGSWYDLSETIRTDKMHEVPTLSDALARAGIQKTGGA